MALDHDRPVRNTEVGEGSWFADLDPHCLNRIVGEQDFGDLFGNGLNQLARAPFDRSRHGFADLCVVNRSRNVISCSGLGQVQLQLNVDQHILSYVSFLFRDADMAGDSVIGNEDFVH